MRSINKVILIGNLTRDPEMRQTPNGQSVTTFGLATNRQWVTRGQEKKNSAEFHECVAWARLAEICAEYIKKGNLVYVEGYLKTRSWDGPDGARKFKTEIVVQDMILLEKRANMEDYVPQDEMGYGPEEEESPMAHHAPSTPAAPMAEMPSEQPATHQTIETQTDENPIDKDLGL